MHFQPTAMIRYKARSGCTFSNFALLPIEHFPNQTANPPTPVYFRSRGSLYCDDDDDDDIYLRPENSESLAALRPPDGYGDVGYGDVLS